MRTTRSRPKLVVSADGNGVVNHAGGEALRHASLGLDVETSTQPHRVLRIPLSSVQASE